MTREEIIAQIRQRAQARGMNPDAITAIVAQESNFNPSLRPVQNGRQLSSAFGLFQMLRDERAKAGIYDTTDIPTQIEAGLDKTKANYDAARGALGRDPSAGELYVVHYQGIGAGPRILSNPQGRFADTLNTIRPGWANTVLRANPWLAGINTNQDFISWAGRKMDQRLGQTGAGRGGTFAAGPPPSSPPSLPTGGPAPAPSPVASAPALPDVFVPAPPSPTQMWGGAVANAFARSAANQRAMMDNARLMQAEDERRRLLSQMTTQQMIEQMPTESPLADTLIG